MKKSNNFCLVFKYLLLVFMIVIFALGALSCSDEVENPSPSVTEPPAEQQVAVKLENNGIKTSYVVGDIITLSPTIVELGGTAQTVTPILHFPDGTAKTVESLYLEQTGKYVIEYKATVNGQIYKTFQTFMVYQNLVSFKGSNSSATYADGALTVNLAQYDVFTYNRVIDLQGQTRETPFIEFSVEGMERYSREGLEEYRERKLDEAEAKGETLEFPPIVDDDYKIAGDVFVKLEDINNANNYLLFRLRCFDDKGAYTGTGASTQPLAGWWLNKTTNMLEFDTKNAKGTHTMGFNLGLAFDAELCTSYLLDEKKETAEATGEFRNLELVNYKEDFIGNPWTGFSNNLVKLSIYTDNFEEKQNVQQGTSYIKISVKNICGHDLSTQDLVVNEADSVAVNFGSYNANTYPNALINHPYKIFDYDLRDKYGLEKVDVSVFYELGASFQYELQINGGAFIPTQEGMYTIRYTTTDRFGNVTNKDVLVRAMATATPITAQITGVTSEYTAGIVGVKCPIATEVVPSGGLGELSVSCKVEHSDSEVAEIVGGKFTPTKAGTWKVIYTVSDYVGRSVDCSYDVNVEWGELPLFENQPVVPKYFIKGAEYRLPSLVATDYTSGTKTDVNAKIEINGVELSAENNAYIPDTAGNVKIKYTAVSSKGQADFLEYNCKVVDVNYTDKIDVLKYFSESANISTSFSTETNKEYLIVTASGNAKTEFINSMFEREFAVTFNIGNNARAEKIIFHFTDVKDASKVVKVALVKTATGVTLVVDGQKPINLLGYEFSGGSYVIEFNYGEITIGNVSVKAENFNGFYEGKFYMGVEFVYANGVTGETSLYFRNINSQPTSKTASNQAPRIFRVQSISDQNEIDTVFNLQRVYCADVLDAYTTIELTVTSPTGQTVTSENGVTLNKVNPYVDYQFKLSAYGAYKVNYKASDASGKSTSLNYYIQVTDRIAPEIVLNETSTTVEVGEVVGIPAYSVTDNVNAVEEIEVVVLVVYPNNQMSALTEEGFVAQQAGTYIIRIMAFDQIGNMAIKDYQVTVSEIRSGCN